MTNFVIKFPEAKLGVNLTSQFLGVDHQWLNETATITITGIPTGTTAVSAWVTERDAPTNKPKFGEAQVFTTSVQYDSALAEVRIIFAVNNYDQGISCGVMLILG